MEFLETVTPEVAVISCSATTTYGHPSPETLERLKDAGVQVLITKDTGAAAIWEKDGHFLAEGYYNIQVS